MSTPAAATGSDSPKSRAGSAMPLAPGTVASMIALAFMLHKLIDELCTSDRYSRSCYEKYEPSSGGGAPAAAIIAIRLAFAVISSNAATGTSRVSTAEENR